VYSTGLDNDYADSRSLHGGNNRFLKHPFPSPYKYRIFN